MLMKLKLVAAAVAAAVVLSAPGARAQSFINVLTGGTSGVYYPLGVAIGKIYGDKIPNVKTQVQATKASVENLILLQQGRGEIAFTLGDSLKAAWEGDEEAGFKSKLDKLRTIGAIYPNYIQIAATSDSGIKTLADLKGKSLSVGAPKSGTELNSREILDKIGPPFVAVTIPANTYNGQDKDVPTAAVVNYLVTSSAVSDDLAYQMTKLVYESLPELANSHAAGKEIKLETAATGSPVPLHPGAIRYYKEK